MFVNFSDIPGHQNLFLDYLYDFENVSSFYKHNFRNRENYMNIFKEISSSDKAPREKLVHLINEQYSGFSLSNKTEQNIKLLENEKTLAVVTGQQLGMLGGPMYTFYKIFTAIKLAKHLSERYDDYNFVPVFWLESDDHDVEEVSSIKIINDNNNIVTVKYGDKSEDEESNTGSVGYIKFDESINTFFESLGSNLRTTEFKEEIVNNLRSFYKEGTSFKEAFKKLIYSIFDRYGLIIFDPQGAGVKSLLKPIFKKEISDFRTHTQELVHVSAKLEEVYHAQVKIRPINLFFSTDDGRYLIEPGDNIFKLKRKRIRFTYEEIMNLIEEQPEKFSPNVLLRPICQDYILPTAFYVGGPSEIAYFAQVMPLYGIYNIAAPVIYPRSSLTVMEKNVSSLLEKYNLNIHDVFINTNKLKDKVLSDISENSLDDIFEKTKTDIALAMDLLKEKLFEFDKTVSDSSTKYRQKIISYVDELRTKANDAQKKKYESTLRQLDKLSAALYPNNNLQEREINFIYFAHKYGLNIIDKFYEELEINKFEHQVMEL